MEVKKRKINQKNINRESYNSKKSNSRSKSRRYKSRRYRGASRLTIYQRVKQIKDVAIVALAIMILNSFSNILYIWKLNGVIIQY